MTTWELFHAYRRLAEEGKVKPLACPDCDFKIVTRLNRKNEDVPLLWCPACDVKIEPGLGLTDQVRSVVVEFTGG